jgi:hypothetical protein
MNERRTGRHENFLYLLAELELVVERCQIRFSGALLEDVQRRLARILVKLSGGSDGPDGTH